MAPKRVIESSCLSAITCAREEEKGGGKEGGRGQASAAAVWAFPGATACALAARRVRAHLLEVLAQLARARVRSLRRALQQHERLRDERALPHILHF